MKRNNKTFRCQENCGIFGIICPLFYPADVIVLNSSYLNKASELIYKCSNIDIIIPMKYFIICNDSFVYCGSKAFYYLKGEYS